MPLVTVGTLMLKGSMIGLGIVYGLDLINVLFLK